MDRLFYLSAYGPMHAQGSEYFYVVAKDEEDARVSVAPHLTAGYEVGRVHECRSAPAKILRDQPILNSALLLGNWWDVHHGAGAKTVQPEPVSEGAGQARLFS